jgi:hypothetical protein
VGAKLINCVKEVNKNLCPSTWPAQSRHIAGSGENTVKSWAFRYGANLKLLNHLTSANQCTAVRPAQNLYLEFEIRSSIRLSYRWKIRKGSSVDQADSYFSALGKSKFAAAASFRFSSS